MRSMRIVDAIFNNVKYGPWSPVVTHGAVHGGKSLKIITLGDQGTTFSISIVSYGRLT